MQSGEPASLYCRRRDRRRNLRVCQQIVESLLAYKVGGTEVVPGLAESYEASDDVTTWTFHLRNGVTFHDGSTLDANDVVMSYAVQWDAASPMHVGRDGSVRLLLSVVRGFLNMPAARRRNVKLNKGMADYLLPCPFRSHLSICKPK